MASASYTPRPHKINCFNEFELFSRDNLERLIGIRILN